MKAIRFVAVLGASVVVMGLASRVAHADVTVLSAIYGLNQAKVPGFPDAKCFQRPNIDLTRQVNGYCHSNSLGGICMYTVPWPSEKVDPGIDCYKTFYTTYRCSGTTDVKDKTVGSRLRESANQVVEYDCSTVTTKVGLPSLQSNGDMVAASYYVAPSQVGRPNSDGKILINPWVGQKKPLDQSFSREKNFLTCDSSPLLRFTTNGIGEVGVVYQVTGYTMYSGDSDLAEVNFSLKINGTPCSGAFEYLRDRQNWVEADFILTLNNDNVEIPLNIDYAAPNYVTPSLVTTGRVLTRKSFADALSSSNRPRTGSFEYGFLYQNKYGLPTGDSISCKFGKSLPVSFTTKANGHATIQGTFTVAVADSDSNGNKIWAVTTSLTGADTIFTLQSGQGIGNVTCSTSDSTAVYSYDLGIWDKHW